MPYEIASVLERRWRRLREDVRAVEEAVELDDVAEVMDAVESALDSLYRLTEGLKLQQVRTASETPFHQAWGEAGGETTFGLVYARGHDLHKLIVLFDRHSFGSHGFGEGPFGGGWAWVTDAKPDRSRKPRDEWYARHVANQLLPAPFTVALTWLDETFRPET